MDIVGLISIIAAAATVLATIYAIYRRIKKSWKSLQQNVDRLETSLQVDQRGVLYKDVTVAKDSSYLTTLKAGTEVRILSIDANNFVKIRCFEGLITTTTSIENIKVESRL